MKKRLLVAGFAFFLFSGLAFAKGGSLIAVKEFDIRAKRNYYFILAQGIFRPQKSCDGNRVTCLGNCQVFAFETTNIPPVRSALINTGEKDATGNEVFDWGATGFDNQDEAYRVRDSMCCCEEE